MYTFSKALFDNEKERCAEDVKIRNVGRFCRTPACINGHAVHLYNLENNADYGLHNTTIGAAFLRINQEEAADLFCIENDNVEQTHSRIGTYLKVQECTTREIAVHCLEHFRDTGVVDWRRALRWKDKTYDN